MDVTEARDAAIVRICDCECTAEFGHSGVLCRRAGIGKVDALIAAVRAEQQATITALVTALRDVLAPIEAWADAVESVTGEGAHFDERIERARAALALVPPAGQGEK